MASEDARKLFVAGLPDSVTEEVLRGLFSESGAQVTELTLPRDRMSGRPRGFAFVRLGSQEDADRARQVLDGRIVDGKAISVRPFQAEPPARGEGGPRGERGDNRGGFNSDRGGAPSGDRGGSNGERSERPAWGGGGGGRGGFGGAGGAAPDRTLYVGNLPYDTTQEEIETLLRDNGVEPVVRVHLPVDQDGRKRGFGFVTLGSADVAKTAIENLKGADLRGRRLNINIAHPKEAGGGGGGAPRSHDGPPPGDRPPRAFGPPPSAGFGPPPGAFGPPASPAKGGDGRRKKSVDRDGGSEGRARAAAGKRDREERWRDVDDDE